VLRDPDDGELLTPHLPGRVIHDNQIRARLPELKLPAVQIRLLSKEPARYNLGKG
jgi:hypothetical protein